MVKSNLDKATLQNILHHGNIGIHVIDNERKTKIYNQVMADLEGLEINQVMDKDILEIFPSLSEDTSTLIRVMNKGEPILNSTQTYLNFKGQSITTISSTIPLFSNEKIIGAVEIANNVTNLKNLSDQLMELQKELVSSKVPLKTNNNRIKRYKFSDIIGESESLSLAKKIGKKASNTSSSVLIFGETGTGKELFAQSIHNEGIRKRSTFIAQNCAAIPESLLEGILFGTEKGGFTGAVEREGIFEQANGGTLMLDEINSMSLPLQAKLLRVLQEGYIRRIGGVKDIPVDVRIIATTNEDPLESISKGTIRKDLYYRLNVVYIPIPPLRERKEDIELLCQHFIDKYNPLLNKDIKTLSKDVINEFKNYSWPGNIRELENFIEGAMNMASLGAQELKRDDFLNSTFKPVSLSLEEKVYLDLKNQPLPDLLEHLEKEIITKTLNNNDNNITISAKELGVKRQTLQHKIKKYRI